MDESSRTNANGEEKLSGRGKRGEDGFEGRRRKPTGKEEEKTVGHWTGHAITTFSCLWSLVAFWMD
jgi:hypothetical protein